MHTHAVREPIPNTLGRLELMKQNFNYKKIKVMKKQHYTAEIPVSNPYNFAAFEDLIANIQSGYNEEKG